MTATATVPGLARIPLGELHESPWNPRKHFDPKAIEERMDSLLASGQFTPILVRPLKAGGYEVGAGHVRLRAAKLACEKHPEGARHRGLDALDAIVRDMDDATFIELLNIENLQRDDLDDLDEAEGFRNLMVRCRYDVKKIAARIGKSDRYVYDSLTLLKLIPQARVLFLEGKFERGHAIELARLSEEWQKKALDRGFNRYQQGRGGLWEAEDFDADPTVPGQERLKLEEKVKPVSVREFKTWIDNNVRANPDLVDPVLFPDAAQLLSKAQSAKGREGKIVHITYDHQVPYAAKDNKIKTHGAQAWKRADGNFNSKPCEHQVVGFVAAGPGRGEAFLVCISKEKCSVHWREWQRERERRVKERAAIDRRAAKESKKTQGPEKPAKPKAPEPDEKFTDQVRQAIVKLELPVVLKAVRAIIAQLAMPDDFAWNLASAILESDGLSEWTKPPKRPHWSGSNAEDEEGIWAAIQPALCEALPGKFGSGTLRAYRDAAAARSALATEIYLSRDFDAADVERRFDRLLKETWRAELKGRAVVHELHEKKPQASAKAKGKGKRS